MGDKSSLMFAWCRCAALCAIVCLIAACVPTNPAGSSPDPAWQSAEPEESGSNQPLAVFVALGVGVPVIQPGRCEP
jgi:hypothetical protein